MWSLSSIRRNNADTRVLTGTAHDNKGQRVKALVASREVAHLWAHAAQDRARNTNSTFYFEGDTIYSYGPHFPIARRVDAGDLARGSSAVVLFTLRDYSVTTAKHKSYVRRALAQGTQVFYVENVKASPADCLEDYRARVAEGVKSLKTARRLGAADVVRELLREASVFADTFGVQGVNSTGWVPEGFAEIVAKYDKRTEKARAKLEAEQAENERRAREADARCAAEFAEKIGPWLRGEDVGGPYRRFSLCRIVGDEIQTTNGARVPLEHVKRALPLVLSIIGKGGTYKRNGHTIHLGHYVLDEITAEGVVIIGCHRFQRAEVDRVAGLLGVAGGSK
jgi:hypothetical protein